MSLIALTAAAALLVASPDVPAATAHSDAVRVATNGGFLLGSAHRCGIAAERVVRAGQLVRHLILAAARDADEQEQATLKFTEFFLTAAFPENSSSGPVASCPLVAGELTRLEHHRLAKAGAANNDVGGSSGPRYSPGAGE